MLASWLMHVFFYLVDPKLDIGSCAVCKVAKVTNDLPKFLVWCGGNWRDLKASSQFVFSQAGVEHGLLFCIRIFGGALRSLVVRIRGCGLRLCG